jgi:hypothetical protein
VPIFLSIILQSQAQYHGGEGGGDDSSSSSQQFRSSRLPSNGVARKRLYHHTRNGLLIVPIFLSQWMAFASTNLKIELPLFRVGSVVSIALAELFLED